MKMDNLKRQLGLRTSTALVVGEVVAIGIFITPAAMAKSLASPAWILCVWLAMGLMTLCGALCYGELASRYPEAGGGYVYLRESYGRPLAFLHGWMSLLVMDPGITAALAVGVAGYVGYIVPLSATELKALAVLSILLPAVVNIIGLRIGAGMIRWLTFIKLGLLLFLLVWGFGLRLGDWSNFLPLIERRPDSGPLIPALAGGMIAAFFSFGGWWDLNKLAGEVKDPAYTLPRALSYGVIAVTIIYVLTSAVFLYLVPLQNVVSPEAFAAQAGEVLFGTAGGQIFSGIVIIAVVGSIASLLLMSPRVYFAMARDGVFLHGIAHIEPRFGTPARAIALQAILASILALLGTFNQIVSYFVFVAVIFLALTVIAVFILRNRQPSQGAYLTPGYPVTPAAFLFLTLILLVLLGSGNPKQAFLGITVVAMGLPVYYVLFGRTKKLSQEKKAQLYDMD
jgi:APA family basic amino acid/polyamine antiporter